MRNFVMGMARWTRGRGIATKGLNNAIGDDAAQRRALSKAANADGWKALA